MRGTGQIRRILDNWPLIRHVSIQPPPSLRGRGDAAISSNPEPSWLRDDGPMNPISIRMSPDQDQGIRLRRHPHADGAAPFCARMLEPSRTVSGLAPLHRQADRGKRRAHGSDAGHQESPGDARPGHPDHRACGYP